MFVEQAGLARARNRVGRNQSSVETPGAQVGRVIAVDTHNYKVDVVIPRVGTVRGAKVTVPFGGRRTGLAYLPTPSNNLSESEPGGKVDTYAPTKKRDVYAVVDYQEDDGLQAIVRDFVLPNSGQMVFALPGTFVQRHETDHYIMMRPDHTTAYDAATDTYLAEYEQVWPDGTYLRVGQGTAHADLTGQDAAGQWKVRGTANANAALGTSGPTTADRTSVTLKHSSGAGLVIDPSGNITFYIPSGAALKVNLAGTTKYISTNTTGN